MKAKKNKEKNKTLKEMARFRLKLMDQHYTIDRMIKVVGQHREATIEYFSKSDLSQNFDVRLETGVSLHQSPTIQTQLLIQLWREGILTEQDRVKVLIPVIFINIQLKAFIMFELSAIYKERDKNIFTLIQVIIYKIALNNRFLARYISDQASTVFFGVTLARALDDW